MSRFFLCLVASLFIAVEADAAPPAGAMKPTASGQQVSAILPINALTDKHNIPLKAIVRSNAATLHDLRTASVLAPAQLMDRYYIYGRAKDLLSVGSEPRQGARARIAMDDVFITSTMLFAAIRSETLGVRAPVAGFASQEDIVANLKGDRRQPIYRESRLNIGRNDRAWMPVLEHRNLPLDNSSVRVLKIGAWNMSPTHTTAGNLQAKVDLAALNNLNLLVLCDCTASTAPSRAALNEFCGSLFEGFLKLPLNEKAAVAAYRDDDPKSQWWFQASNFTDDVETLTKWVGKLSSRGGGDFEEKMFEALDRGIDKLQNDASQGSYSAIIILADNAGKTQGSDPLLGDLGCRVLQRAADLGIVIHGVQVPSHPSFKGDQTRLPKQLQALADATGGVVLQLKNASPEQALKALNDSWSRVAQDSLTEKQVVSSLAEGQSISEIGNRLDLPATVLERIVAHASNRLQVDLTRLETPTGTIGVDEAWVVYSDTSMALGVLIGDTELETLVTVIDALLTRGVESPESLAEVWTESLGVHLGEDSTLSDALQVNGIPVRTGLLSVSLPELIAWPRSARRQWATELDKKYRLLVAEASRLESDGKPGDILPVEAMP